MAEGGVLKACSQCAQGPAGSCCFEGVEDWYDPVLLLINLLLDAPLPSQREIPKACFFVGQGGCKLRGRYAFCVNFLCPKLNAGREDGELLRATGEELLCGWELEKAIRAARVVAFAELGMEAIYEFDVKDMPVTVAVDAQGTSVHNTAPAEWSEKIRTLKIPVRVA